MAAGLDRALIMLRSRVRAVHRGARSTARTRYIPCMYVCMYYIRGRARCGGRSGTFFREVAQRKLAARRGHGDGHGRREGTRLFACLLSCLPAPAIGGAILGGGKVESRRENAGRSTCDRETDRGNASGETDLALVCPRTSCCPFSPSLSLFNDDYIKKKNNR